MNHPPCIAEVRQSAIEHLRGIWENQAESAVDWLLCDLLDLRRLDLQVKADQIFPQSLNADWHQRIKRASEQEPVQYIIGHTAFRNLDLLCDSRGLIPRPETEQLIDWILSRDMDYNEPVDVLDLATGSGCIALSLATEMKHARVTGTDLSPEAVSLAKENHLRTDGSLDIRWIESDLFNDLPDQKFDLIVSNPPYISDTEWKNLPSPVQHFEPAMALTDEQDGLRIICRIIEHAPLFLKSEGWLYLEIGEKQREDVQSMFEKSSFENIEFKQDYAERLRMVRAQLQK